MKKRCVLNGYTTENDVFRQNAVFDNTIILMSVFILILLQSLQCISDLGD